MEQNWDAAHTALNICLFPPLFFVSGLYYTDVLSTLFVVLIYSIYLRNGNPVRRGFGVYVLGIASLGMRQTNIFWAAVFLAGLEWVRTCKAETTYVVKARSNEQSTISDFGDKMEQWKHGLLHDPKLSDADITGKPSFSHRVHELKISGRCVPMYDQYCCSRTLQSHPSVDSHLATRYASHLVCWFCLLERRRCFRYLPGSQTLKPILN